MKEKETIKIMLTRAIIEIDKAQRIPYHVRITMIKYNELVQRADRLAMLLIS